jgi:hypothetical protein
MKVNIPMVVTAADTIKRTITGTIVTWNEARQYFSWPNNIYSRFN